ncbi:hypothetical protein NBRC116595_21110 [Aliiglaciecola sp. NS0011-25]
MAISSEFINANVSISNINKTNERDVSHGNALNIVSKACLLRILEDHNYENIKQRNYHYCFGGMPKPLSQCYNYSGAG